MSALATVWPLHATFALASIALAATPGPGVIYIVTRTVAQGRHVGLASVAGVALGNFGNALTASVGLAALLAAAPFAFDTLRYAGAAYLVWLGLKTLRAPALAAAPAPTATASPALHQGLREGFVVALLNPKTALFFAAFLPPFIDPAGSAWRQCAAYGAAFVAIAACIDTAYVLGAGAVTPLLARFNRTAKIGRFIVAAVYLGLGMLAAASGAGGVR